jgi:hypothetical protein
VDADTVESVLVSARGDVCIMYSGDAWYAGEVVGSYRRCLLMYAEDIESLAQQEQEPKTISVGSASPEYTHLPADIGHKSYDRDRIAAITAGWPEVSATHIDVGILLPYTESRQLMVWMSPDTGIPRRHIPVRAVLTLPAIVIDVLTAPLQLLLVWVVGPGT